MICFISGSNEHNVALVERLTELGFENLVEAFIDSHFTVESVMNIEKSDLIDLGLTIGQARQFLMSLEDYRKQKQDHGFLSLRDYYKVRNLCD